jgi:hypothetical protein
MRGFLSLSAAGRRVLCSHDKLAGEDLGAVLLRRVGVGDGNEPGLNNHLSRNQYSALHIPAQPWLPLQDFSPGDFARLVVAYAPVGVDDFLQTCALFA